MSPEQVRGQRLTPASDVFCLGSVLAYAATGRMPFGTADSGVHAVMFRIAEAEPDLDGVPPGILDLVRACLAKDPARRPVPEHLVECTDDAPTEGGRPWLPGPLLAQLGRHAAQLLEADTPAPPHAPRPATVRIEAPRPQAAPREAEQDPAPRSRPRSRAVWISTATVVAVLAATAVLTHLPDRKTGGAQQAGGGPTADHGGGDTARQQGAGRFDGSWEGTVQRADSSVSDEHEYLRIDVDGNAGRGEKAADVLYLSKDTYCKIESTLGASNADAMRLSSSKVVRAVPESAAGSTCDLARSSVLKAAGGRLDWAAGELTANLRPVARPGGRPIPDKFLGTWKSEIQGTLTIKQGPVGTRVGKHTGWSIDWRCNGTSELVAVTADTVTLSPLELDATTPRNIGCPHGVPETITWKSRDELELRYPESIAVHLTRVG